MPPDLRPLNAKKTLSLPGMEEQGPRKQPRAAAVPPLGEQKLDEPVRTKQLPDHVEEAPGMRHSPVRPRSVHVEVIPFPGRRAMFARRGHRLPPFAAFCTARLIARDFGSYRTAVAPTDRASGRRRS